MRHLKNKSGFTLLEIIIVIIIIGVLASLALPRFFKTVEFSRSAEALAQFAAIRSSMERCYVVEQDYSKCDDLTALDIENPNDNGASLFSYEFSGSADADTYTIKASRKDASSNYITLTVDSTSVKRGGAGNFSGIK